MLIQYKYSGSHTGLHAPVPIHLQCAYATRKEAVVFPAHMAMVVVSSSVAASISSESISERQRGEHRKFYLSSSSAIRDGWRFPSVAFYSHVCTLPWCTTTAELIDGHGTWHGSSLLDKGETRWVHVNSMMKLFMCTKVEAGWPRQVFCFHFKAASAKGAMMTATVSGCCSKSWSRRDFCFYFFFWDAVRCCFRRGQGPQPTDLGWCWGMIPGALWVQGTKEQ